MEELIPLVLMNVLKKEGFLVKKTLSFMDLHYIKISISYQCHMFCRRWSSFTR